MAHAHGVGGARQVDRVGGRVLVDEAYRPIQRNDQRLHLRCVAQQIVGLVQHRGETVSGLRVVVDLATGEHLGGDRQGRGRAHHHGVDLGQAVIQSQRLEQMCVAQRGRIGHAFGLLLPGAGQRDFVGVAQRRVHQRQIEQEHRQQRHREAQCEYQQEAFMSGAHGQNWKYKNADCWLTLISAVKAIAQTKSAARKVGCHNNLFALLPAGISSAGR